MGNIKTKYLNVAVVIPCRNEETYIGRCIQSVLNSDFPQDNLEIYVVDGLSTDNSLKKIKNISDEYPCVHLLINDQKTTPFALNKGITAAKSAEIIIILGAHAEIFTDYISNCIKELELHPEASCVGGVLNNISENSTTQFISYAISSSFGVGNAYFRTGNKSGFVDTVGFGAYKSAVFAEIGLFDEELIRNQDDEFNYRMIKNGYKIYLSNSIKANYYVRSEYGKLFKQYFQYGYWKVYVNTKHKTITTLRQIVPFIFVNFLFFGAIASSFNCFIATLYAIILILYLMLSLVFSFHFTQNIFYCFKVITAFFILHTGYGLGYLKGIVDFLLLRKKIKKLDVQLTR